MLLGDGPMFRVDCANAAWLVSAKIEATKKVDAFFMTVHSRLSLGQMYCWLFRTVGNIAGFYGRINQVITPIYKSLF